MGAKLSLDCNACCIMRTQHWEWLKRFFFDTVTGASLPRFRCQGRSIIHMLKPFVTCILCLSLHSVQFVTARLCNCSRCSGLHSVHPPHFLCYSCALNLARHPPPK